MFRLLLYGHLQAEPYEVLYTTTNALHSTKSRLHVINIYIYYELKNKCNFMYKITSPRPEDGCIRGVETCCCYK